MSTQNSSSPISSTEEIIAELKAGHMVILVDDEDRENEGDLVLAAEHVSPEAINFMVKHARGLVCLTITEARRKQLGLAQMALDNRSPYNTAFTVSIEASSGVTTGISAQDRACTVQAAVAKNAKPEDIVQPGHIFPITAKEGGVLVRAGHTEAGCDLAMLAGLEPSSVICEILKEDGSMARLPDLIEFAQKHSLKIGTIADLIHYRSRNETLVKRSQSKKIHWGGSDFMMHAYTDRTTNEVHLALVKGEIESDKEALVRVHEPLSVLDFIMPGDRHSFSIEQTQALFRNAQSGVLVLLHRPENGQDLLAILNDDQSDKKAITKRDPRIYGIGAQILRDLGVGKMKLIANPLRLPSMTGFALEITGYVSPDSVTA